MMYLGDFPAGATVHVPWNSNLAAGGSVTIAVNGTAKVYRLSSLTERTSAAGITFIEDFDAITGRHLESIDTSDDTDAGFYASGSDFGVARDGMTIDGQTVNVWLALFSIENRSALRPTVAGRTLGVTAAGRVGPNLGDVENPTAVLDLSGTTVKTATEVATGVADLQSRTPAALVGGRIASDVGAVAGDSAAAALLMQALGSEYLGTVTGATTTTTLIDSGLTQADTGHWTDRSIIFLTGALARQAKRITGFTPATDTLTFEAFTAAPGAGDTFLIV